MLLSEVLELVSFRNTREKDQPIALASKSLTDAETWYANIEIALLAIVFACQHCNIAPIYLEGASLQRATTSH